MDVVDILGPRKALKRSKPMPNFGLPSNRPCSAGTLLKRTTGDVNIPKLMANSTAALESNLRDRYTRPIAGNNPIVYQAQIFPGQQTQRTQVPAGPVFGTVPGPAMPQTAVAPVTPQTAVVPVTPQTAVVPVTPQTAVAPVKPQTAVVPVTPQTAVVPVTPQTAVVPVTPQTAVVPVTPQTAGGNQPEGVHMQQAVIMNDNPVDAQPTPEQKKQGKKLSGKPPKGKEMTGGTAELSPESQNLVSSNVEGLGNRSKLSLRSNKSFKSEQSYEVPGKDGNNAGGDFHQEPSLLSTPNTNEGALPLNSASSSVSSGNPDAAGATESNKVSSASKTVSKHSSKKNSVKEESEDESDECQEPQLMMSNNGAIRFQLPGRVQHKTTIKLSHYPDKPGENVIINVPEGDQDNCCVDNGQSQFTSFNNTGSQSGPPGNNPAGLGFFPNQSPIYTPGGNSVAGQNYFYPPQQQQYMQQNGNNFDYGFMGGGQCGMNMNDPYGFYSGPPPSQNYPSYGYGHGYPN